MNEHLPWKQIKIDSSDKPWITSEIKSLISKRQTAWAAGNNLMFRFYRNKVNALCKKARLNYYNKSIAGVQQSDSRKWWSVVNNIAGLQSSKNVSTIMFEGKSYSDADLANLLNDKLVAVGSSLPSLNWLPLPTNDIPDYFCTSVEATEKALLSSKLHSSAVPMKFLLGSSGKTLQCCADLGVPFLMLQFVKDLFPQYGRQKILHQFKNLRPLKMLILTSDQSLSHQLSARFLNPFPTNGFLTPSQKKWIPCNFVR